MFFSVIQVVLISNSIVSAATVKGQLTPKSKASNLPVVLLRFDPSIKDAPPMAPLARTDSDKEGYFVFPDITAEPDILYLIGVLFEGKRIASKPFKLNQPVVQISVPLPSVRVGLAAAVIQRNALVVHQLPAAVRITEIISLQNPTPDTLDGQKKPWSKPLPQKAVNFRSFSSHASTTIQEKDGLVQIFFTLAPGKTEALFEYDLPINSSSASFKHYFWKDESNLEVIVPTNSLNASIANQSFSEKPQTFNEREYRVLSFFLPRTTNYVQIELSNLPLPKNYFGFILIGLLLVMLFSLVYGVFRYKTTFKPKH